MPRSRATRRPLPATAAAPVASGPQSSSPQSSSPQPSSAAGTAPYEPTGLIGTGGAASTAGGSPVEPAADPVSADRYTATAGRPGGTGTGGEATGGPDAVPTRDGLPLAAAAAPVGVLGAAGAVAWAVHRRNARDEQDAPPDEDEE